MWTTSAQAGPRTTARAKYQAAVQLVNSGNADQALVVIDEGLAAAPDDLELLGLKGRVLLALRDYPGALAAYETYLDSGVTGANQRSAQQIVKSLSAVRTTFLDIALSNGRATIYLDSRTQGVFCIAEPSCNKSILPGDYRVLAERPGFEIWTGRVSVHPGATATLAVTLVEKPSRLTVRAPPGAQVTVDGAPFSAHSEVAAGTHHVVVSLAAHRATRIDTIAHEGQPIALDVVLAPLTRFRVEPPTAALFLDGKPVVIEPDGVALPAGDHGLVARAKGYVDRAIRLPAGRTAGDEVVIVLERLPVAPVSPPVPSRFTTRRKIALAVAGLGVAAGATGLILGVQSEHLKDSAFALCPSPTTVCAGASEANSSYQRGLSRALQADIAFGAAATAAIIATVLWWTGAPESRIVVSARVDATPMLDVTVRF